MPPGFCYTESKEAMGLRFWKGSVIRMKLGFVSAILGELSFEEMMDFASENGF